MNETAEYVWGDTFGTRLNSLHLSVQKRSSTNSRSRQLSAKIRSYYVTVTVDVEFVYFPQKMLSNSFLTSCGFPV